MLTKWKLAKVVSDLDRNHNQPHSVVTWEALELDAYKCNVDATFWSQGNSIGWGMCIRDHKGKFVPTKTIFSVVGFDLIQGEALGLLHALSWVVQLSLPSVIFEMDCKSIVDRVLTEVANVFEVGFILTECKTLLLSQCNFKVKFLRQQVNMVVHVLARTSIDYASPTLFNSMPTCIYHFIINDTS